MRAVRFALLALVLWASTAAAQAIDDIDLSEWDSFASLAERILAENRVSEPRLTRYREDLTEWRSEFLAGQELNATQIAALESQLEALGPPPEEGSSEPDSVATERAELAEQLAEARAPGQRAEAAFARANALIAQIDQEIRDRQTDAFFELAETPLNPANWPGAVSALIETGERLWSEVLFRVSGESGRANFRQSAPLAFGLVVLSVFLIARGPIWTGQLQERVATRSSTLGADVWRFVISFGEILLPVLGMTALIGAVRSTGILGPGGTQLAVALNVVIFAIAVGRWLARRVFPQHVAGQRPIDVDDDAAGQGRWLTRLLAMFLAAYILLQEIADVGSFSDDLTSVVTFPFILLQGLILFRLARLLLQASATPKFGARFSKSLLLWLGRFVRAVSVVGPLAAAIGYANMGAGLVVPTVLSLALIAVLMITHGFLRAAWGLFQGLSAEEIDTALVPILVSFALTIGSIPLLALTWGVRSTDLIEIWTQFLNGLQFGETRIRPGDFLTFVLVFAIGFATTRLIQGTLRTSVLPRTRLDPGGQSALISGLGYVLLTLSALVAITAAGIDLSSIAIVVGALGVGIGFGLQNIVNNFVSGIIMLIERPIGEGDWVEVNGHMGIVKSISVRSTRVETFDRTDVIVPNGDIISGTVTNWTRGNSVGRVKIDVGVAYGTDTRQVTDILQEICQAHPIVAADPKPAVYFRNFGADSLEFTAYCILKDVNFILSVHSDLNHSIHERFVEEGIEIPFAQRDVWLRNPEALQGQRKTVTPSAASTSSSRSAASPEEFLSGEGEPD